MKNLQLYIIGFYSFIVGFAIYQFDSPFILISVLGLILLALIEAGNR